MTANKAGRSRWRRAALWTPVGLIALLLAAGILMRVRQNTHGEAERLRPNLVHVRNFFTDLYGYKLPSGKVLLFDAGVGPDGTSVDAITNALGVARTQVTDVFLTHGHFDHIAAAPGLATARVHIGIRDSDMAAQRAKTHPSLVALLARVMPVPPVLATDAFLGDRAQLPLEGKTLTAVPLPGHTPGSYVYALDGVLFAGDSIQIEDGTLTFANPATTIDLDENKRSLAQLRHGLAGERIETVCTGHQGCIGNGDALLNDLIERASHP